MAGCLNTLKACILCKRSSPASPPPPPAPPAPPLPQQTQLLQDRQLVPARPPVLPAVAQPPCPDQVVTLEDLDALLDAISSRVDCLDPNSSGPSSSLPLLSEWKQRHGEILLTDFMKSLPDDLKTEVAGTARDWLMPLVKDALGGVGGVHWLGLGFSFIAWSLDNLDKMAENREEHLQLLRLIVRILKGTKEIWQEANRQGVGNVEDLQDSVEKAFLCALVCTANLEDPCILRFLKASSASNAIASLKTELEGALQQNRDFTSRRTFINTAPHTAAQVTYDLHSSDIIVGRMEVKEQAMQFLIREGDNILAVVLHGMGGIGKSTLGMEIFKEFQKLKSEPQGESTHKCCRVELPLELKEGKLVKIQREILAKLTQRQPSDFYNLTDGMVMLEEALRSIKLPIFLYIDNISERQDLMELIPQESYFPRGSKVLVTTRVGIPVQGYMVQNLNMRNVELLEVRKLEKGEARNLLWHTVRGLEENKDMKIDSATKEVEERVLELCDGLPLALKVVGSYIASDSRGPMNASVWKEVAAAMEKAEPFHGEDRDELYHRLRFSIDNLDFKYKSAFLDIVAFGAGKSWKFAELLVSSQHLEKLHQRALVQKARPDLKVEVHDVLKKMGMRRVVDDKSTEIRILNENDLQENIGSLNKVVGVRDIRLDTTHLKHMLCLRILYVVYVRGEGVETPLKNLVYAKIQCEISKPFCFSECTSLKTLDWSGCQTATNFEVLRDCRGLESLRIVTWPRLEKLDAVESMRCLTRLRLHHCPKVRTLPEGIVHLTALQMLILESLTSLRYVPEGISGLTGLTQLELTNCSQLQSLPAGISALTGLKTLVLKGCAQLQALPDGISRLTGLQRLSLRFCKELQALPESVFRLTGLQTLDCGDCVQLQALPEGVSTLTGLKMLGLAGCVQLQTLPEGVTSLTGLTELSLSGQLPQHFVGSLPITLADLTLVYGGESLEAVARLSRLTSLALTECTSLQSLPQGFTRLTGLTALELRGCQSLQSIPEQVGSLTHLSLSGCNNLSSITQEGVQRELALENLSLKNCESLASLPKGIGSLTNLTHLTLEKCNKLQSLPQEIGSLTCLKILHIWTCESLQSLTPDDGNLASLNILTPPGSANQLQSLILRPHGVAGLTQLEELILNGCASLRSIPEVANLTQLTTLFMAKCRGLRSLPEGLARLTSLRRLDLSDCESLQSLPQGIGGLRYMRSLALRGCSRLYLHDPSQFPVELRRMAGSKIPEHLRAGESLSTT